MNDKQAEAYLRRRELARRPGEDLFEWQDRVEAARATFAALAGVQYDASSERPIEWTTPAAVLASAFPRGTPALPTAPAPALLYAAPAALDEDEDESPPMSKGEKLSKLLAMMRQLCRLLGFGGEPQNEQEQAARDVGTPLGAGYGR